jgi:hypothetical protein
MSFIQNLLLQGFFIWHNQRILESQRTFRILAKTSNLWITLLHSSFDLVHALIFLLSYNDLTLQGGCLGDVEQ